MRGSSWEWTSLVCAVLALILVIANSVLVVRNQGVQFDVSQRQQVINQGLQYARIRQVLAQVLAQNAVGRKDAELTDLLARHGININPPTSNAPAAPAPATPGK